MIQKGITIGVAIAIVVMVYMIAKKLGVIGSRGDKKYDDILVNQMESLEWIKETPEFDPGYWRGKTFNQLTSNQLQSLAKHLDDGFRGWWLGGDDEAKIYAVFEQMESPYQVSQLSEVFRNMYKTSLRGKLIDKFDSRELAQVKAIIENY